MSIRFLTAGESHGKALIGIIEGLPSGCEIDVEFIYKDLLRRKLGYGRGARQKIETDQVEILSGIRHGKTLGSPICLLIWNKDWSAWKDIMQAEPYSTEIPNGVTNEVKRQVHVPRPGHADLVGGIKYNHRDMRNVLERSSARETAMRVALGAIARKFLLKLNIHIASRVTQIGSAQDTLPLPAELPLADLNCIADGSATRCLNKQAEIQMIQQIDHAKAKGDTLGGIFEVYASGIPIGLGSYVQWDRRLEGEISKAFMSLNAIKGVEIGGGFQTAIQSGSVAHDELFITENWTESRAEEEGVLQKIAYRTNRSGGIDGGMSTGQPIVVRAGMKPLSTLMEPLQSVNLHTGEATQAHIERSDVCAVPAAAVIGEGLLALTLTQAILEKFGGDSMEEIQTRIYGWDKTSSMSLSES